jgi:hypothetical protein
MEGTIPFMKEVWFRPIEYAVTVKFLRRIDNRTFHVTNVYGPSHHDLKLAFVTWFLNLDTTDFEDWVIGGDFNMIREPSNRNKSGGDQSDMELFNDHRANLDLIEIPFSGKCFTWSNMQDDPLLVKLDWVFTSSNWALSYPGTFVQPLARPI